MSTRGRAKVPAAAAPARLRAVLQAGVDAKKTQSTEYGGMGRTMRYSFESLGELNMALQANLGVTDKMFIEAQNPEGRGTALFYVDKPMAGMQPMITAFTPRIAVDELFTFTANGKQCYLTKKFDRTGLVVYVLQVEVPASPYGY